MRNLVRSWYYEIFEKFIIKFVAIIAIIMFP